MKGIYTKSKYAFLLSLIKFYSQKEEIIYFLEKDTIKNLNLDGLNVIVLNDFKKGNYLINKYKKWKFNNELLKKIKEIDEVYLQEHIPYSQFFLNNLKNEFERKEKKVKLNHYIKRIIIEKRRKDYKRFGLSDKVKKYI